MLPYPLPDLFPNGLDVLSAYFRDDDAAALDPRLPFNSLKKTKEWIAEYERRAGGGSFCREEPWLTIVALYGLFGDQTDLGSRRRIDCVNKLMRTVFSGRGCARYPSFASLHSAAAEVCLPQNLLFRNYLRDSVFRAGPYHPYADRRQTLARKLKRKTASLEGSTNVDALISGHGPSGNWVHVFIEAKFLSDCSKDISYLPVRNQVARNIDCALDLMTGGGANLDGIDDFWFLLLTPSMFRTRRYGGAAATPVDIFAPSRSRLYCYKMDDYMDPELLRRDLPHWSGILGAGDWERISKRIGWMTFEDVVEAVSSAQLLPFPQEAAFKAFFADRAIGNSS